MNTRHRSLLSLLTVAALVAACDSNPSAPADDGHDHELTASLTLSESHVHTLSELTFTVEVTNDHGEVVTDLDGVTVERLLEGSTTWRGTDLQLSGTSWTGAYTFATSGAYQMRVSVLEHGATAPEVVYAMPDPLDVVRAHAEIDGMRVEFESFPGHIHTGETATLTFWVMEPDRDANGVRPPLEGLHVEISCGQADGSSEMHHAVESAPGVYEADHVFTDTSAGEFHAGVHIGDHGGMISEAEFHTHVAHAH